MPRSRAHTRRAPQSRPTGVLSVRASGFGFVKTAEGEFFVPAAKMGGAFDGDLVEVAPLPAAGKGRARRGGADGPGPASAAGAPAARVVRVIDRAHDTVIGRYEVAEPFGVVVPEDPRIAHDIFTMRADNPHIPDGAIVRVRITAFPTRNTAATGVVEEVIGRDGDEDVLVDLIVARHKLETAFSEAALAEAAAAKLDEAGALAEGYRDLRDRFTLTIDPADARDFDDALSIEFLPTCESAAGFGNVQSLGSPDSHGQSAGLSGSRGAAPRSEAEQVPEGGTRFVDAPESGRSMQDRTCGARWRLGVHIADVSHYVPWNSSLDLDARRRATSVYLVDRVIPMLPEVLSGDLCSLMPGAVRRAMTVDMYLDDEARVLSCDFYPSLIRSNARLSYDEVQTVLDAEGSHADVADQTGFGEDLVWRLRELSRIAKALAAARERAGGIDFASAEAKVRLDGEGHPLAIDVRRKTEATSLVEEAMILANNTVARHLCERGFPSLYRVHEKPAPENLAALVPVLQEFDWFSAIDAAAFTAGSQHAVQAVLAASAGRPEAELVSSLVLRAMKRAVYRPSCEGHYGLSLAAYTHFTSPIRRYPDLVVHRMLKAQLTRRPGDFDQQVANLAWIAEHSSDAERVAEAAARESQETKIIEFHQRSIGQTFSAVVSGVATYGLYVRLDDTAEGLVPVRRLGDEYFAYDPVRHTLSGQDTGRLFRLGQRVAVVLEAADPRTRRLDFRLAN